MQPVQACSNAKEPRMVARYDENLDRRCSESAAYLSFAGVALRLE